MNAATWPLVPARSWSAPAAPASPGPTWPCWLRHDGPPTTSQGGHNRPGSNSRAPVDRQAAEATTSGSMVG
jgi:hypothetical protein